MFLKKLMRQTPGEIIRASTLNRTMDVAEWLAKLRVQAPMRAQHLPGGPLLSVTPSIGRLAVANGNIPAGSGISGGTGSAGVGSVYLLFQTAAFSGGVMTSCTLTQSTIPVAVYNPSPATMTSGHGIDSGMICWVIQDASGFWCVWPLQCS